MLEKGNIELAKFVSPSTGLLKSLNPDLVAEKCKVIDFDSSVTERALGVIWNVSGDFFTYSITQLQKSLHVVIFCPSFHKFLTLWDLYALSFWLES